MTVWTPGRSVSEAKVKKAPPIISIILTKCDYLSWSMFYYELRSSSAVISDAKVKTYL